MKKTKFILLGAAALLSSITSFNVNAEIPLNEKEIKQIQTVAMKADSNITQTVINNLSTPFFNEPSIVNVNLVLDPESLESKKVKQILSVYKTDSNPTLSAKEINTIESSDIGKFRFMNEHITTTFKEKYGVNVMFGYPNGKAYRDDQGQCNIDIYLDKEGKILEIAKDKEVLELTELQNQIQTDMVQKFVVMHEQAHCEFSTINAPIFVPGKSASFQEDINSIFKDLYTDDKTFNLMHTLNENYADISAIYSLIREYGRDDANLNYVIEAIKSQRQDNYYHHDIDSHFTHLGLEEALKPENISKMLNINQAEEMNKFILEMANQATFKIMADNDPASNSLFSKQALLTSLHKHFLEGAIEEQTIPTLSTKVERGFSYQFAQEMLKKYDASSPKYYDQILDFSKGLFEGNAKFTRQENKTLEKINKTVVELQEYMISLQKEIAVEQSNTVNLFRENQKALDVNLIREKMNQLRANSFAPNIHPNIRISYR